jgi:hypothetical protein
LYLNVIRPSGYENKKLPVAFWIHGGTFTNGTYVLIVTVIEAYFSSQVVVQTSVTTCLSSLSNPSILVSQSLACRSITV